MAWTSRRRIFPSSKPARRRPSASLRWKPSANISTASRGRFWNTEPKRKHPTSNIQHPTSSEAFARRVLDVQCSMLVVGCFPCLNLHGLLVFRHDDLGVGFHAAQGLGVREALRFFAVDADDLLEVAGDFLDV